MKVIVNYIATTCFFETPQNQENEFCIEFQEFRTLYRKFVRGDLLEHTAGIASS
jgi:hypothetical protein